MGTAKVMALVPVNDPVAVVVALPSARPPGLQVALTVSCAANPLPLSTTWAPGLALEAESVTDGLTVKALEALRWLVCPTAITVCLPKIACGTVKRAVKLPAAVLVIEDSGGEPVLSQ